MISKTLAPNRVMLLNFLSVFFLLLFFLFPFQNSFALPALSNEATLSAAKTSPAANFGKGIELDGINDWINIPDLELTNDFTVEGWVKLAPGIDTADALFGQEGPGPDINFYLGRVRLFANGDKVTAKTALLANTWGHIAITRSGNQLTLYVNGEKDATGTWDGTLILKAIGRGNRGFLKGALDEIRVWKIARTGAEINANFNSGVDPNAQGLIGYWTFNNTDQIVTDLSSSANHGTLGSNTKVGGYDPVHIDSTAPFVKNRTEPFVVMQSFLFDENKPSNEEFKSKFLINHLPEFGHGFAMNWDVTGGENPFYDAPNEKLVKQWATNTSSNFGFLHIDHLPVSFSDEWDDDWVAKTPPVKITDVDRKRAIHELATIVDWAHEANPKLKIGYYGILPEKEYWALVQPTKMFERFNKLHQRNKNFKILAEHVDVIFPSIYTFYNNPEEWKIYAQGMLDQARQYNKPIYAFIWPIYHSSNATLGNQFIAGDFWRIQLETIYKQGFDGVVIWGGHKKQWNESTSETDPNNWWYQTLAFMHSKGLLPADSTWKP